MKKRIMLDAGHYGKRNQSPILPEYYESERMWLLCELLAKELSVLGFEVFKTRESLSKDLAVVERGKMAADCDLFLSLHSNATGNGNTKTDRVSVYAPFDGVNESHTLGKILASTVAACMDIKESHVKTRKSDKGDYDYYGVMRGARSVGCPLYYIIEHSFHTNEEAAKWLMNDVNLKSLAIAEATAIAIYFGLEPFIKGDVNQNGKLDIYDAILIKRAIMDTIRLSDRQLGLADLNCDGKLNTYDYIAMKKKLM
ncbi:MAG: N-acetylmuramoyl-L-alanine amidase [Clostridia bacterium]|nr:N-acetylmuramoyl-L-alanine amidase [Clostridia bacterium]